MKCLTRQAMWSAAVLMGVVAATLTSTSAAFPKAQDSDELTGEWWQWALSIPATANPLTDLTGQNCMVGQRGDDWFLAGTFGATSATRACSIPEDTTLFFPVINYVGFDTPNACGQGSTPLPSSFYRQQAADFINGAVNLSVRVDGKPIKQMRRVRSEVFALALPQDNLFNGPSICDGTLPAGIYSPAVDDGYYVRLNPLAVGHHTLQIHAENPSAGFVLDVTYNLTVVRVVDK